MEHLWPVKLIAYLQILDSRRLHHKLEQEHDSKNFLTDIINWSFTSWLTNFIKCRKTLYIITLCPCYASLIDDQDW